MSEQRVIALDGIRGLAALGVVLPHYFAMTNWQVNICEAISIVGVELFFVLSGFVLAPQIIFCLSGETRALLPTFFIRRWMRTLPPYALSLTITAILTGHVFDREFTQHLFFVQNIFSIDSAGDFFAPAWSLSVEEWFYVVFPLFLILMRLLRCTIGFSACLFIFIFLFTKLASFAIGMENFSSMRRLVIFRLDSICFGFILFIGLSALRACKQLHLEAIAALLLAVSGLVLIAIFNQIAGRQAPLLQLTFFYITPLFGASSIVLALACEPAVQKFQAVRWIATWLGRISYDMYLFHVALMISVFGAGGTFFGGALGYIILLIGICGIIYYFFERPILAARPGYGPDVSRKNRDLPVSTDSLVALFLDAFWSKRKIWSPAILSIAAVACAMAAVGEQAVIVDFVYALF